MTVLGVGAERQGTQVLLEIRLSSAVRPTLSTAVHPDRIIVDLPNATPSPDLHRVAVNAGGVREVRVALNSSSPAITRVVVDLQQEQPYHVTFDGNRILLMVDAPVVARAKPNQGARPAGESAGFAGLFRREKKPTPGDSHPDAAHPSFGSLQQGIVNPGSGQPGTGNVPGRSGPGTFDTVGAASPLVRPAGEKTSADGSFPSPAPEKVATATTASPAKDGGFASTAAGKAPAPAGATGTTDFGTATTSLGTVASNQPKLEVQTAWPPKAAPAVSVAAAAPATVVDQAGKVAPTKDEDQVSGVEKAQPQAELPTEKAKAAEPASEKAKVAAEPAPLVAKVQAPAEPAPVAAKVQASAEPVKEKAQAPAVSADEKAKATIEQPLAPSKPEHAEPELVASLAVKANEAPPEPAVIQPSDSSQQTVFRVKYVADGVAYLDGGRGSGLSEGMKLEVRDKDTDHQVTQGSSVDPADPRVVAELVVTGLADTSSVTDIHTPKRQIKAGDLAFLSSGDSQAMLDRRTLSATRQYPAIVTFTEGDPLEEEVRDSIPHAPSPAVNRMRGRFGIDYISTMNHAGAGSTSSNFGMVVRADITRIGGTYWNLSGYWRGRLTSRSATTQETVQDLINRTYHLSMTYDNPNSAWVAGFGRLYLPWAPSLETLDGGYAGRRIADGVTMGIFAGSTPDPSSWNYNPDQKISGAFVNFEGGSYETFRYSSTSGAGLGLVKWQSNKPFVFFENSLFYKRYISIYHSLQADSPKGNPAVPAPGAGISRSFFTLRVQPVSRLELDFNHNYLRDIPTYDPQLIGTGLLDKYLFQGFSAGARVEVIKKVTVYGELGRSNRSGDAKMSLNQMYGITFARLPLFGLRADAHYSKFNSAFGEGSYRSISISRNINDSMRLEVLGGDQSFGSTLSANDTARFLNVNYESNIGRNYFLQGGFSINRGNTQSYDQWMMTLGYRFDSKARKAR